MLTAQQAINKTTPATSYTCLKAVFVHRLAVIEPSGERTLIIFL